MTSALSIIDTGKRRTSSGTAEETDIANSGSTLSLYGVEITLEENAILNTSPVLGKYSTSSDSTTHWDFGEVDTLGVQKPKWTIRGVLDDQSASDMAKVKVLRDLVKTKGYKIIYGDLPDWSDGSSNSSGTSVHVESLKMIHQSRDNIIEYTLTLYETE